MPSIRRLALVMESNQHTVPLNCLKRGDEGVICESCLDASDDAYVRALGVRPNRCIRVCRAAGACVIEVGSGNGSWSRVALSRTLASGIRVTTRV